MNKKIKLTFIGVFMVIFVWASEGFNILTEITDSNQKNLLEVALKDANLDKYRLLDKRSILVFSDGTQVELLSVNECIEEGLIIDDTQFREGAPIYEGGVFSLHESGIIIEKRSKIQPKN